MADITFEKGKGQTGRSLPGQDHICGIVFYTDQLPSGFGADARIKQIVSIEDAEEKGIKTGSSDLYNRIEDVLKYAKSTEAPPTETTGARYVLDYSGAPHADWDGAAQGDIVEFSGTEWENTAPSANDVVYSSADKKDMVFSTADHWTFLYFDVLHYHLDRFFKVYQAFGKAPEIHVMIADIPAEYDFAEVKELVDYKEGTIRVIGVFTEEAFDTEMLLVTALGAQATLIEAAKRPISTLLVADFSAITDLTTLPNLRSLSAPKVTVLFGQDGENEGSGLFDKKGTTVGTLGVSLAVATIKLVSENLGDCTKFDIADTEYSSPALANGDLVKDSLAYLPGLETKGYVYIKKYDGVAGTYHNDSHTCVSLSSDYAYLENNQVIDKAIRNITAAFTAKFNSKLKKDPATGELLPYVVSYFEELGNNELSSMVKADELSGGKTTVSSTITDSKMQVVVELVNIEILREINVKIGFTISLT